ncbi:MAG TPA: dephospho-CoA kinase [Bacteroidia bacterium]|nr:dephospho-CoA kinase [Bacteroidia bacterium]
MLKIGITGGIGSGKSTVCSIFRCFGIPVFNADEAGRRILAEDETVKLEVVQLLGESVLDKGQLNRKAIASIVFNDKAKLEKLNAIIHPRVRRAFTDWTDKQKAQFVIDEAAILFESGTYAILDAVIVVTAPEKLRIERVMARDGLSETTIRERMKNQWSEEEKIKRAAFVIQNDETSLLIPQVIDVYNHLLSKKLSK